MSIAISLEEWQKTSFETHKYLCGLQLTDDLTTQQLISALAGGSTEEFSARKKKRLVVTQLRQGLVLETTSFVGRISLEGLQITIRPKIKMLPLLHLLQYAYKLRQLDRFDPAAFEVESLSFQDLLIYQLEQEVRDLLTRGIYRAYMRREERLSIPRGRPDIRTFVRDGGHIQNTLPCIYYARAEDCLLNQVLLAGVRLSSQLTNSDTLRTRLQNLARFHFAEISPLRLTHHIVQRAWREINRLTTAYIPALTVIEILLAAEGISIAGDQPGLRLPGFLFDMNLFFQELIQRFLQDHLPEYEVLAQYEIMGMLGYTENPRRKQPPELRPDYVIKQHGRVTAILDAKYRDLWERDLPSSMLYQLVMYALSHTGCNQATILYPSTHSLAKEAREARIEVRLPAYQPGYVILRPVDLLRLEKLVITRDQATNEQERIAFARWLAFGST